MKRQLVGERFGNYTLVQLLGRGGFAEVYLGQHTRLDMQVAVKVLHTYLTEEEAAGFQREAQVIARLIHPHIVRILDFDVKEGTPFLVMDYAPHGTLRQKHPGGTPLPLPMVISYIKQVADALQYAHDQKLIHRDVKPENMLIGRRGEVVLSDFGIATISHSTSSMRTQEAVGTIPYMAPEQIQAHPRPASDQYALGIVTYEWLTGERPFVGSYTEVFAKHLMTPPPPLQQKVPTLPAEVEQVVLTALAKDYQQRFSSVQAFATALEHASHPLSTPSVVLPPSPDPQPAKTNDTPVLQMPPSRKEVNTPAAQLHPTVYANPPLPPTTPAKQADVSTTGSIQSSPSLPPTVAVPTPVHTPSPKVAPGRKLSRRTVIVGLAATGVLAIGGGITWWVSMSHPSSPTSISPATSLLPYTYRGHSGYVNVVAWSPAGTRIASGSGIGDDTVQVWDAADGANVFTYRGNADEVRAVAWSPDGKRIASAGSVDGSVQVWDAADGRNVFIYRGHAKSVNSVAWSPDGKKIASGSADKTVQVWDAADGGNVYTYRGHADQVGPVAWSSDGKKIASSSADKTVQVWDAADGGNVFTYRGHADIVFRLAWSPDGKRIASGSADKTVQVWDAVNGANVFTYRGHADAVWAVAWSPDGKRIASASLDKTVQVWDAADGANVFTYRGHADIVFAVAWSPDGKRIASGSADETVQVWEAK